MIVKPWLMVLAQLHYMLINLKIFATLIILRVQILEIVPYWFLIEFPFFEFVILCHFKNISGSWRWGICPWATPIRSESSLFCWSWWKRDSVGSGKRCQNSILFQYGNYQPLHFIAVKDLGTTCRYSAYHKGNPFKSLFRHYFAFKFQKEFCIIHLI